MPDSSGEQSTHINKQVKESVMKLLEKQTDYRKAPVTSESVLNNLLTKLINKLTLNLCIRTPQLIPRTSKWFEPWSRCTLSIVVETT